MLLCYRCSSSKAASLVVDSTIFKEPKEGRGETGHKEAWEILKILKVPLHWFSLRFGLQNRGSLSYKILQGNWHTSQCSRTQFALLWLSFDKRTDATVDLAVAMRGLVFGSGNHHMHTQH